MLPTGNKNRGFTLVEVILYLAILSTLVFGIASFVDLVTMTRVKNQTKNEVDQQAVQIIQNIAQVVRSANSITAPTIGQSGDNLVVIDANYDAITYALHSGALTVNRGSGDVLLHNDRVFVSDLSFKNVARVGTPPIIQINLTLSYNNVSGDQDYNYVKTFVSSANLSK